MITPVGTIGARIHLVSRIASAGPALVSGPMPSEAEIREVVRRVVSGMAPGSPTETPVSEASSPSVERAVLLS